ncbi:MAG: flocculation-associated PEP-CTERM protein PepA, partial [Gammaproteobacteria bacterium]|nr:flocculation-associated PEP-CTERM protein PepA [Gammaproteobacteria bacterium]
LGVASSNAMAVVFNDFIVDPSTYSSMTNFTADKIGGNYVEVASFGAGGTFDVSIQWSAGQFVANDGVTALVASTTGLGDSLGYSMYGLFQASGTFVPAGGTFVFTFNPGGSLDLLIDANRDTTFNQPGAGTSPWTTGSNADDILIATGAMINGTGLLDPTLGSCTAGSGSGINCGSFGTTTSFDLTAAGEGFFIDPVPFYGLAFESGQFNNFDPTSQVVQVINGSLDAVFLNVPEPATLALMGIGLIGLGGMRRKKA